MKVYSYLLLVVYKLVPRGDFYMKFPNLQYVRFGTPVIGEVSLIVWHNKD